MKTLALETSGRTGSIAAWDSDTCLTEILLPPDVRTAESLIVGIENVISKCNWSTADLELIAVTQGPGSFTGLRLGCVTAKVLAFAVEAKLVGVNTLSVLAENSHPGPPLWCVMDAGREQCFTARYSITEQGRQEQTIEPQIMEIKKWLQMVVPGDRITGPLTPAIAERLPAGAETLSAEDWLPRAEFVARVGIRKFQQGQTASLWEFSPHYYRLSAAEEKQQAADHS